MLEKENQYETENAFEDTDYPTTFLELQHVEEDIRNEMITHLGQESMFKTLIQERLVHWVVR